MVLGDRCIAQVCYGENIGRRQGYYDRNVACHVDTMRALISHVSVIRRLHCKLRTGSHENSLPFRRYDGVTLATDCVSVGMVAAIESC